LEKIFLRSGLQVVDRAKRLQTFFNLRRISVLRTFGNTAVRRNFSWRGAKLTFCL